MLLTENAARLRGLRIQMDWVVLASLILFTIIELLLLPKFSAKRDKIAKKSAIASIAFLWLTFIVSYIFKFKIPNIAYIFIIASLLMDSFFGYYKGLYYSTKKFDRIQHVIGSFSFAIFFYFFLSNIFEYGGSKVFQAFYILLLGVFYGTIYELIEFMSDSRNRQKMQKGLRDTDFDMLSDLIGSLAAAVLSYYIFIV